jgi:hypothetical protein
MHTIADQVVNVFGSTLQVEAFVSVEFGGDGGEDALPFWVVHAIFPGLVSNSMEELSQIYLKNINRILVTYLPLNVASKRAKARRRSIYSGADQKKARPMD